MREMPNIYAVGPHYCETPPPSAVTGDLLAAFPLEAINVWTSAVPALLGLLGVYYLYRHRQLLSPVLITAVATAAVGVGSMLWHGLRTPLTLTLDVVPGLFAFLSVVYLWPHYLFGIRGALATLIALFGGSALLTWLIPIGEQNGPPALVFVLTALIAGVLVLATYRRRRRLGHLAALMIASALIAAAARTIDLYTCHLIPFGTHFIWHLGLGVAAFLAVVLLARLACVRKSSVERPSEI